MHMKRDLDRLPVRSWYPGHMLKAGRAMQSRLNLVDLVAQLLDARLPAASRNPALRKLFASKPQCFVFTKTDLADPTATRQWSNWFRQHGVGAHFVDSATGSGLDHLASSWRMMVEQRRRNNGATRPLMRPVRVMVVGIPNVGKSTLTNRLSASRKAKVGPKPGVTRDQQWIPLRGGVEVLDTPGVLWPKIDSKRMELKLGLVGTLPDELSDPQLMAEFLHEWACTQPGRLDLTAYDLEAVPDTVDELLAAVGRRRGFLKAGGVLDLTQCAQTVVNDFRDGRLGRVTLDPPPAGDPCNAEM